MNLHCLPLGWRYTFVVAGCGCQQPDTREDGGDCDNAPAVAGISADHDDNNDDCWISHGWR